MNWLKSLPIWAVLGGMATAAFMFWRAYQAGVMEAQVEHDESRIKDLNNGTVDDIAEAKKLQGQIKAKKIQAREVRKKSEAAQERIGTNESMADIAHRFNSDSGRVRKRTAPIAPVRGSKKSKRRTKRSN